MSAVRQGLAVLAVAAVAGAYRGKGDGSSPTAATTTPHGPGSPTMTPGTILPGENIPPEQAAALQQSIDEGHQPWRVHPDMVAEAYVASRFGWDDVQAALADPHTVEITNRPDGRMVTLQLRQPVRQDERD